MSTLRLFAPGSALAFSRADIRFALLWGLLPNAIFLLLSFFAAPMRTPAILAYFLVGLLSARLGGAAAAVGLGCAVVFDVLWVISGAYNLSITMVVESVSFAWRLNFFGSPIFFALAVGLAAQFAVILWLRARWRADLAVARPYAGLLLISLVALIDASINLPPTRSIIGSAHGDTDLRSATELSGFADRTLGKPGDALLVLVEGYGVIADARFRNAVEAAFADEELRARYDVQVGAAPFNGSTTAGEMRELCDSRNEYTSLASDATIVCLPERLAKAGYDTLGVHAFTQSFFDRDKWWPRLGLQEINFAEQFLALGDRRWQRCGAVFTGLCDLEMAGFIAEKLAAPRERPLFTYWLTLNTHIPLMPETGSSDFGCGTPADVFGDAQTCAMADIWEETFRAVAELAMAHPSGLEVLVVGDHAPPSWTRRGRNAFEPGVVRWISLTPRQSGEGTPAA